MKIPALRLLLSMLGVISLGLAAAPTQAAAPAWTVNKAASKLSFSGTHTGDPFNGTFGNWNARISFDPKDLKTSRIIVVIATVSAKTGDAVQESSLAQDEWFSTGKFPTATFTATDIRSRGGNNYVANGTLLLKGKKYPVSLPFTVRINGKTANAQGTLELDRVQLGLGLTSDPKAEWVSRKIKLSLSVTATR